MRLYRLVLITLCIQPLAALAIDLQPNDIVAPLPGKNHAMISYLNTDNSTYYLNGSIPPNTLKYKSLQNPNISTQSAILRVSTSYTLSSLPAISYVQLPYGTIKPAGSLNQFPTITGASIGSDTGIGDTTFATAIWPYADREAKKYFGIAGYFTVPTGSYNSQRLTNMGENRYKSDIQMGYQQPIVENLDGMIAVDTMWFGGNGSCQASCLSTTPTTLNQKPLTTTQVGPIYKINQTYTVGASYFYVAGGATTVGNEYKNNVINTQRFLLSGLAYYPFGRISLQYGRDMEIKNGFVETRRLALRFTTEF
ncbi:transporter [Polynucleobacter sp. AP-Titi-500A-B4]|uniref:transporter n=1 Tax=Polynucleobacter sp. AP-Titi-500A-B4 TaxID=2576923 RepID=UPI001BFE2EB3|nr:transporter [Polynucleobacter sp. AP-Titi-500A-B4]QWE12889.1 transporter [Polynucleobacter sp. AP-Titi-500A-B4]